MAVQLDQIIDQLIELELLTESEIEPYLADLERQDYVSPVEVLLSALHEAGRLTRFQAHALAHNRGAYLRIGEYLVQEKIGSGGMGDVFKAYHRLLKRTVAIKLLPKK
ncbi:MAG: hypothetical protein ACYTGQ_14575, partial [Planctomycetota bacterium]